MPPALLDLILTITAQLPDGQRGDPLRRFNNNADATADMIALLEEVRDRIRTSPSANR